MPYCHYCGKKIPDDEPVCSFCGMQVAVSQKGQQQVTQCADLSLTAGQHSALPACSKWARIAAAMVDFGIAAALVFVVGRRGLLPLIMNKYQLAMMVVPALYLVLRDSLGGKSIGKLLTDITVISTQEKNIGGFTESLLRNAVFAVIAIPGYGSGIALLLCTAMFLQLISGSGTRFGDKFANTIVVNDRTLVR